MKKGKFFIICLVITVLGCLVFFGYQQALSESSAVVVKGVFHVPSMEEEPDLDCSLAGEWEYYPDTLLVTGNDTKSLPGNIMSSAQLWQQYGTEFPTAYQSSLDPNPEAAYKTLPELSHSLQHPLDTNPSCASYRLILKDCYQYYTDDPLFLCLCGNLSGNYRVFVNGKLRGTRMSTPWGYPNYLMDRDATENEIIIEVSNSTGGLNITPRLMTVATSMTFYDVQKNISMILASVLIAIFIVLLFSIISSKFSGLIPYFLFGLISTVFYILSIIWGSGFLDSLTVVIPNSFLHVLESLLFALGVPILFFILHRIFPAEFSGKLFLTVSLLALLSLILHLIPGYVSCPLLIGYAGDFLYAVLLVYWIICVIRRMGRLNSDQILLFSGILVTYGGFYSIHILEQTGLMKWGYMLMPGCIIFNIVLLFIVIWRIKARALEHTQMLLNLEKDNVRMQTAMYSSQINPHFLYNTLMTIQEMCYSEPKEAANLIVVFSRYLRDNIDFMESSELISFQTELNHIKNFIFVQKARFEDKLQFNEIIETDDFLLPPLTVQPIVENAIKYGVRANEEGGTVLLHTFEKNDEVHIVVENDGPGFDPEEEKTNHSLNNIKKRLDILVNGTLTITSAGPDTRGVKVEIILPMQK